MAVARYVALAFVIAGIVFLALNAMRGGGSSDQAGIETVMLEGESFLLEVAATPEAIEQGLMGRESIPVHGGMLFLFGRPHYPNFWMKNCLVDIDVMFLDELGRVVATHEMKAEPPRQPREPEAAYKQRLTRYPADRPVLFAIELRAGTLRRLGIEPGDRMMLDVPRLKRLARSADG